MTKYRCKITNSGGSTLSENTYEDCIDVSLYFVAGQTYFIDISNGSGDCFGYYLELS
ncbi:MAG: hypothetical protein IJR89_07385 [Clostridia bacterium]|nr:hypothetical protein [Clostridia bacterium]